MSFFSHHDKQHAGDTEPFNCDDDDDKDNDGYDDDDGDDIHVRILWDSRG